MILFPLLIAVASFVAGHPVQVSCEAHVANPAIVLAQGYTLNAWTDPVTDNVLHMRNATCKQLNFGKPGNFFFDVSLETLVHESFHQKGIMDEACTEKHADQSMRFLLKKFYHIGAHSMTADVVYQNVMFWNKLLPDDYHWNAHTCSP